MLQGRDSGSEFSADSTWEGWMEVDSMAWKNGRWGRVDSTWEGWMEVDSMGWEVGRGGFHLGGLDGS